ncbi:gluconate:H+ symporter [Actinokineospora globicatena]|uniref:GntT/GntP/DsdX family permease n=1 Tax=Actinokineospora globicatena TaxID=103729 RepID=UPI0020A384F3|nr:gluconate:H+ symporter [Actinokineospora globicatena]MCP2300369.1 gluconate:H+ symporter, GntP family [Actinokineospora globicatena]GLW80898.1 gluconate:H+ symporter, GntP family protein [Actinokineospora globicatena]GLW88091.1 gluconate:H+ symporter, GntP family protein [Actinokineospora globicatena]
MTEPLITAAAWTGHDTRLVGATVLGIALIVVLITKLKFHPFLALVLGSGALGLVAGMPVGTLIESFTKGVGSTVAGVGVLIALGAMLGKLLADSGGADQIVDTILGRASGRKLPWAMALVAALIGLPMFFEIGLVMLIPVVLLAARRSGKPLMLLGIPALAGLSVLHGLVPPHPGPLVAVDALKADLGLTLGLGVLVAIPTVIIAGPVFAKFAARWVPVEAPVVEEEVERPATRPSFAATLATVLLPVVLMLGKALADILLAKENTVRHVLDFLGAPLVALLLAVLVGMVTLGHGFGRDKLAASIGESLPPIAGILLIVGAGGGFKQTLVDAGVGDVITGLAKDANFSPLLLGWLIAVAIRLATGSATVATISAAGIIAPLAVGMEPTHAALLALAIGAGSLFFSHVNDAGFWLVKEYFGLSVGQTIKTWSVMETLISVVGILIILPLSWLL